MGDVKRYDFWVAGDIGLGGAYVTRDESPDGKYVLYTDVEAALSSAPQGWTFEDAKQMLRGAQNVYGGGHSGKEYEAFQHGLQTALQVLENARKGDTQTAANLAWGLPAAPATKEG